MQQRKKRLEVIVIQNHLIKSFCCSALQPEGQSSIPSE